MRSTIDNKGVFENLGSSDKWPEAIQAYKQASKAMLLAYEKQSSDFKELRTWRAIYTFLKAYADATVEINQDNVVVSINGKIAVVRDGDAL